MNNTSSSSSCGVYYAPSTIPGAGYGLFAGRAFRQGDQVLPGDLVVPLVELEWHNDHDEDNKKLDHLWGEYQWSSRSFEGMDREGESVSGISFGVGAVPNCLYPLINLEESFTELDWAGLHRSRDPGAGAITPYHNRRALALKDIAAGMELYVNYGERYFDSREDVYGPIPGIKDYEIGDDLLNHMIEMLEHVEWIEELTEEEDEEECTDRECRAEEELWSFALTSDMLALTGEVGIIWKARPLLTLPEDATHVDYLLENGVQYLHYNRSVRDPEWLEDHGVCVDNLGPGLSTLSQAGRGAFATRNIPQGQVIAPMPLIHVPNRSIYTMYGGEWSVEPSTAPNKHAGSRRSVSNIVGYQLLLNYCFGHRHSTLLLCPYGPITSLINHPARKEEANARIVWSTKASRHPEWKEQDINHWGPTKNAGLAFDLIALRDIQEGEEVFLWYGDEWEEAWQAHVGNWQPPLGADDYEPSLVMNERLHIRVRTVAEGSYDRETDKILYCREVFRQFAGAPDSSPYDFQICRVLDRYLGHDGEYRYLVETYKEVEGRSDCWESDHFIIFDLPRDGINFRDALYSLDHSQQWAFRHDLRIPDDIMPEVWLNAESHAGG